MAETDPQEILAQARRYAEDLTLFEGRHFIVPEEVVEQASGLGEEEISTSEETSASEPAERESVVASDEGLTLDAFREEICTCTRCPLGSDPQSICLWQRRSECGHYVCRRSTWGR